MSGPKVSIYELSSWAKKNVLAQIRCEQDSLLCAKQIEDLIGFVSSYRFQLENLLSTCDLLTSRGIQSSLNRETVASLIDRVEKECSEVQRELVANRPSASQKYFISEEALAQKKECLSILRDLKKRITALRNEVDAAVDQGESVRAQDSAQIENSIAADLSGYISFDSIEVSCDDTPEAMFRTLKADTEKRLGELAQQNRNSKELDTEIAKAFSAFGRISTLDNLRTFNSITVKALEKKIEAHIQADEQRSQEFAADISRYQALCAMLELTPESYTYSPERSETVKCEIERLEGLLVKQHEQSYISECVDEVMAEMGYDLIGTRDVKKRSGKKFRNELFTFNEGTAVNVTYSSDGQIAMELGGIAREDRLPTEEESSVLTTDMETFCGEFEVFEQKLRERGIVLGNRIALSPPSAEYAAIINVNDYKTEDGKQISEINAGEKRKGKTSEKKVLRRDE